MSAFKEASEPDENGRWGSVNGFPITEGTIAALVADAEAGFPNASIFQLSGDADRSSALSEEKGDDPRSGEILATAQRVHQGQERTSSLDDAATNQE